MGPSIPWRISTICAISILKNDDDYISSSYTYMFVVNFGALAGRGKNRNQTSCLSLLNPGFEPGSLEPNPQQTKFPVTNRLSYRGSSKNVNATARPYDHQAFSLLDPTAIWLLHLALAIYMFVVVNFDALAQARNERRQVVFHCWIAGFELGSLEPNFQQTECPLTNRLVYRGSSKNLNPTARPYDLWAFSLLDPTAIWLLNLALAIYIEAEWHI